MTGVPGLEGHGLVVDGVEEEAVYDVLLLLDRRHLEQRVLGDLISPKVMTSV